MNDFGNSAELFLSPNEKVAFANWKETRSDRSLVNRLLQPLFRNLAQYVPSTVAPNFITLIGLVVIIQAWYFDIMFHHIAPQAVSAVAVVSITLYWICHGLDGCHAHNTKNDTALGELFKYVIDGIVCIFIPTIICNVFGASENIEIQWYAVQTGQIVLLYKHHSAFLREAGMRYWFFGPGEVITFVIQLLFVHAIFGVGGFVKWYNILYASVRNTLSEWFPLLNVPQYLPNDPDLMTFNTTLMQSIYYIAFSVLLMSLLCRIGQKHSFTRYGLLLVVVWRFIPATLYFSNVYLSQFYTQRLNHFDVIIDGLFMSVVTTDIIVAKMANRDLHHYIIVATFCVMLPQLQMLIVGFVAFYYIALFADISFFMNMPMLSRCVNVYCDGVFDLCHIGHKNLFKAALKNGNRLFVGVMNDEDCAKYKRAPIMTHEERCAEVDACKHVTKVIPNAPCFGLTEEFIKEHRIHVVCCGQEYIDKYKTPQDDPYYGLARKMEIVAPLPRTEGLSTSDLIRRITESTQDRGQRLPDK